ADGVGCECVHFDEGQKIKQQNALGELGRSLAHPPPHPPHHPARTPAKTAHGRTRLLPHLVPINNPPITYLTSTYVTDVRRSRHMFKQGDLGFAESLAAFYHPRVGQGYQPLLDFHPETKRHSVNANALISTSARSGVILRKPGSCSPAVTMTDKNPSSPLT